MSEGEMRRPERGEQEREERECNVWGLGPGGGDPHHQHPDDGEAGMFDPMVTLDPPRRVWHLIRTAFP